MTEMNGVYGSSRRMRLAPATPRKSSGLVNKLLCHYMLNNQCNYSSICINVFLPAISRSCEVTWKVNLPIFSICRYTSRAYDSGCRITSGVRFWSFLTIRTFFGSSGFQVKILLDSTLLLSAFFYLWFWPMQAAPWRIAWFIWSTFRYHVLIKGTWAGIWFIYFSYCAVVWTVQPDMYEHQQLVKTRRC
jgi:hypothetical protein